VFCAESHLVVDRIHYELSSAAEYFEGLGGRASAAASVPHARIAPRLNSLISNTVESGTRPAIWWGRRQRRASIKRAGREGDVNDQHLGRVHVRPCSGNSRRGVC